MAPKTRIYLRRGTAAAWTSADPILGEGEAGFETDTGKLKIGDGSTAWTVLSYFGGGATVLDDLTDVNAPSPSDLDVLTWDATPGEWIAAPSVGGPPSGSAGGDLSGTYPNPDVVDDSHAHTSATAPGASTTGLRAVDFLVGTATAELSGEIAVGSSPGGELGGTWASPTVDATHAGSTHIALSASEPGAVSTTSSGTAGTGTAASKDDHSHDLGFDDATIDPANIGTTADGTATSAARKDHVHATGAGTPSTQAFGDSATTGTGPAASMTDHKHAMPADPTGKPLALTGATAATRYVGGTASGAPASGTFAVGDFVIDQTGVVWVCTVAGSPGTWVSISGSASFATPSIALGSSAAAGAAGTVIRSDSTIAAFDATVPVTQAFGDTAATGSVAFAARRDHKHGMPSAASLSGYQWDYVEITSNVSIASTTEGTPTTIITGNSVTYDGAAVWVEFFTPYVSDSTAANVDVINIWIDSTDQGRLAEVRGGISTDRRVPVLARRKLTPTNAAHTIKIVAWATSNTTGTVNAGAGGSGAFMPAYIRVTKA